MNVLNQLRLDYNEYPEYSGDVIMSNFDHLINIDVKEAVLSGKYHACYPGWYFHARVWRQNDIWNAEIWVYGNYQETISNKSLSDLKSEICDKYGSE